MRKAIALAAAAAISLAASSASAAITLNLVASYNRPSPFGLAFDGSKIWWSDNSSIHEMTTSGVDTGNVITGAPWSALAWDPNTSKLAVVVSNGITEYNRPTSGSQSAGSLNPTHTNIAGNPNFLTDGLDIQGNTLWWSPDVSFVAHSPLDGSGVATTFLPSGGGYSGVEYVSVGANNWIFVVNDATSPRQLCYHDLAAVQQGCTTLPNSRYEDLAFDGRYLWAADYYGGRIDQIDVLNNGTPILGVPEPTTWALLILGIGAVGASMRRRSATAAV